MSLEGLISEHEYVAFVDEAGMLRLPRLRNWRNPDALDLFGRLARPSAGTSTIR